MESDFEKSLREAIEATAKAKARGAKFGLPQDLGIFFNRYTAKGARAAATPVELPPWASGDVAAWEKHALTTLAIITAETNVATEMTKRGIDSNAWQNTNYADDLVAAELGRMGATDALQEFNERRARQDSSVSPEPMKVRKAIAKNPETAIKLSEQAKESLTPEQVRASERWELRTTERGDAAPEKSADTKRNPTIQITR